MTMLVQLDGVRALDARVWKANLSPGEAQMFKTDGADTGEATVLLLVSPPRYDSAEARLTFDAAAVKLLVLGSSKEAILVAPGTPKVRQVAASRTALQEGDGFFFSSLPKALDEIGRALLEVVRSKSDGQLRFYPKSGRYVEYPDNFWTVKPQPRDMSFRITVRGAPDSFHDVDSLELKPDQSGYSAFKLRSMEQISAFSRLVDQIRRRRG